MRLGITYRPLWEFATPEQCAEFDLYDFDEMWTHSGETLHISILGHVNILGVQIFMKEYERCVWNSWMMCTVDNVEICHLWWHCSDTVDCSTYIHIHASTIITSRFDEIRWDNSLRKTKLGNRVYVASLIICFPLMNLCGYMSVYVYNEIFIIIALRITSGISSGKRPQCMLLTYFLWSSWNV